MIKVILSIKERRQNSEVTRMKKIILALLMITLCALGVSATVTYTLTAPANLYATTATEVIFNWTATTDDATAPAGMTTWIYLSTVNNDTAILNTSGLVTNATWRNITVTGLTTGFYAWYLITNDSDGNTSSVSRWFEIRDVDEQDLYYWENDSGYVAMTLNRSSGNLNISGTFMTVGAVILGSTLNSGAITATTLDTGQGANELYDMNQNVNTTSDVTFNKLSVAGDVDVSRNFTGNQIYGEMYYYNRTATELDFASDGVFYTLYMTDATHLNGFSYQGGFNQSSNLTAEVAGIYKASFYAIGSGQNNHIYETGIFVNATEQLSCIHQFKMAAGGDVVTHNGDCFVDLIIGDVVSVRTADVGATGTGNYYGANLNLVRIGD